MTRSTALCVPCMHRYCTHACCYSIECRRFLTVLQEELNDLKAPAPHKELSGVECGSAQEHAEMVWQYERSRESSAVTDLFGGQRLIISTCRDCGHQFYSAEHSCVLELDLPEVHECGYTTVQVRSCSAQSA